MCLCEAVLPSTVTVRAPRIDGWYTATLWCAATAIGRVTNSCDDRGNVSTTSCGSWPCIVP